MLRLFYFVSILIIPVSCSNDKLKDRNIEITIDHAQSYKYDLTKGVFTVFLMDKPDTAIIFHLSGDERNRIVDQYYELGIDKITGVDKELGVIIIDDGCMIMPKITTVLHVKTKNKVQDIQIDENCNDYYLGNAGKAKSVKQFLKFIDTIVRSKPEIKNAPRSNVIYM